MSPMRGWTSDARSDAHREAAQSLAQLVLDLHKTASRLSRQERPRESPGVRMRSANVQPALVMR